MPSIFSGMTKDEFKEFMGALVEELRPVLRDYYSEFLMDRLVDDVANKLRSDPRFQERTVTSVLLLAAAQVQEDKTAPPVTWVCRCGAVNGVNLEKCRVCDRREGEQP
jgi:hypothetical protein